MMKLFLQIVFIFLVAVLKAQPSKSNCTPLTKADLLQKEKVSDFVPATSKGSVITHYQFLGHFGGKTLILSGDSDSLDNKCKNTLKLIDFGSNLYIDIVYWLNSKQEIDICCYKIEKH